jgi:predicted transcriptional regulator
MNKVSIRLNHEAESRLTQAILETGKSRNMLINEAIVGFLKGADYDAVDRAALIRERREKLDYVRVFDEREFTASWRKW